MLSEEVGEALTNQDPCPISVPDAEPDTEQQTSYNKGKLMVQGQRAGQGKQSRVHPKDGGIK